MLALAPLLALFAVASAGPIQLSPPSMHQLVERQYELKPFVEEVQIHESCNVTQTRQLKKALADVKEITQVAHQYAAANGPDDALIVKWFGNASDYVAVLGALDSLLNGNKDGVLLRCDNPDGNCGQEGWAGHYRGSNATSETVICDLSYEIRKPNEAFCALGYTVAASSPSYYWSTDLIHRLFHVPLIADGRIAHYADSFQDCLELAEHNATYAPYNTHTIQYFVSEVYANTVAAPGVGCTGEPLPEEDDHDHSSHSHDNSTTTASASAAVSSSAAATSTSVAAGAASVTVSAAASCHTHADGEVHCE